MRSRLPDIRSGIRTCEAGLLPFFVRLQTAQPNRAGLRLLCLIARRLANFRRGLGHVPAIGGWAAKGDGIEFSQRQEYGANDGS